MNHPERATLESGLVERHLVSSVNILRRFTGAAASHVAVAEELRAAIDACGTSPQLRLDGVRAALVRVRDAWLTEEPGELRLRHAERDAENQLRALIWVVRHHQGDPLEGHPLAPGESVWHPKKEAPRER